MLAMKRSLRFVTCFFLGIFLSCPVGHLFAAEHAASTHKVTEGESIRSLILHYGCVASMNEYSQARAAFATLNPGIFHSALLVPGSTISVPMLAKGSGSGCLSFQEQHIVRVEFEAGAVTEKVRVYLDGPVLPDMFVLKKDSPVRVVCDFDGTLPLAGLPREILSQGRMVRKIRVGHEDKPFKRARIVLEVEESLTGRIEQEFFEQESLYLITVHEGVLQ